VEGLEGGEGHGGRGPNVGAIGEARGQVQGQDGEARGVHPLHEPGVKTREGPLEPGAEEGVHHHLPLAECGLLQGVELRAVGQEGVFGLEGVPRLVRGGVDPHPHPFQKEVPGQDQAVPAVVALARQDHGRALAEELLVDPGRLHPRPLHEEKTGVAHLRRLLVGFPHGLGGEHAHALRISRPMV
jgi:hypothetical protein